MNYTSCPVDDCCGGTLIADNGMRARCRNCGGRGVVEAPRVTVTHDGPPVFTPALGEVIANGRAYQTGWDDGIREGERRMLWNVVIGAEWSHAFRVSIASHAQTQRIALDVLSASGDEDASRVLGERGW